MKEIVRSVLVFVVMSVFTGIAYPYVITALSHLEFRKQANGSMVGFSRQDHRVITDRAAVRQSRVFSWTSVSP